MKQEQKNKIGLQSGKIVFYDVDTQNDFMREDGALSVPGAESLRPNLESLTNYARQNGIEIYHSRDKHFGTEEYSHVEVELTKYGGPFGEHCMAGTYGWENIEETTPKNPVHVESSKYSSDELTDLLNSPGEKVLEKQSLTLFINPDTGEYGNQNAEEIAEHLKEKTMILYGVYTAHCVIFAAEGFAQRGVDVYVVEDAIYAVGAVPNESDIAIERMKAAGVKFVTTNQVVSGELF
ncbi:cysteine hydrolase [Candidatus Woesearchaeota archaeon]|jgi:nicotinamidase/pyrazinamidase|nr:cysteine hydrolase [Candidatus Woesearchaeota archaeon]